MLSGEDGSGLKAALREEQAVVGTDIFYYSSKCEYSFLRDPPFPGLALDQPELIHARYAHAGRHIYVVRRPRATNGLIHLHLQTEL